MDQRVSMVVPTLKDIKKMIKQEGISSGRLQSLRLPKELNLGGTKPKKVYTPNLNVVRNKSKQNVDIPKPCRSPRPQKRSSENKIEREQDKRLKYIQNEGVFSQGMGELKPRRSQRSYTFRERNNSATPRPKKNSMNANKIKPDIAALMKYDSSDESDSNDYDPVLLPLDKNEGSFYNCFKIKREPNIKIKIEKDSSPVTSKPIFDFDKAKVKIEKFDMNPNNIPTAFLDDTKEYDEDNPALSLIRVPNSFFGKIWDDDPKVKQLDYSLKCFPEGQMGKIRIRKSGRMEFVVKNISFELVVECPESLTEMAVQFPGADSIALEPSLVTIGSVTEKLMITPEWNSLFNQVKKQNKFYW